MVFKIHIIFQWVFLPEGPVRNKLVLPPAGRVDYRAACFCHRELITIGFVCSVCLSGKFNKNNINRTTYLLYFHLFTYFSFLQIQSYLHNLSVSIIFKIINLNKLTFK